MKERADATQEGDRAELLLRVHVPIACFRDPFSREYLRTYPIAPLATVYGFLLSMVGEIDRLQHRSAELFVGRLRESPVSRVLRTTYRWKVNDITSGKNRSPDWQELLSDVRLVVGVRDGRAEPLAEERGTLRTRVEEAFDHPERIDRFGGLSLGESTHLIDGVWRWRNRPIEEGEALELLRPDTSGTHTLPIWPNHVGASGTRWGTFSLDEIADPNWLPVEGDWTPVLPL